MNGSLARLANIALGAWLFLTAFLWPHNPQQFINTWALGLAIALIALVSMAAPWIRYLNTLAGAWLVASIWMLPPDAFATTVNNAVVGTLVFLVSLVPSERSRPIAPAGRRIRA